MATNPLQELIPAKARKYVYGLVLLAAVVFGAWQAAEGNIEAFIGSVITALVNALALSNTPTGGGFDPGHEHDGHVGA